MQVRANITWAGFWFGDPVSGSPPMKCESMEVFYMGGEKNLSENK
jgi:hypothetical protein